MAEIANQVNQIVQEAINKLNALKTPSAPVQVTLELETKPTKARKTRVCKVATSGSKDRIKVLPKKGRSYVSIEDLEEEIAFRKARISGSKTSA